MQGDTVKSLRIIAENKGWDPTKIDGKPIEVGLTIRKPDGAGDVSLSPFPGPAPDNATYDNPVQSSSVDWSTPGPDTSNKDRRSSGGDPFDGKPL